MHPLAIIIILNAYAVCVCVEYVCAVALIQIGNGGRTMQIEIAPICTASENVVYAVYADYE